jgi:hypothetical protein
MGTLFLEFVFEVVGKEGPWLVLVEDLWGELLDPMRKFASEKLTISEDWLKL